MTRIVFILLLLTFLNQQNYCQKKIDDLEKANARISILGSKIDSLSQEVEKEKIAKDFFSSQISIQTTIFSVIATLAVIFIGLFNFIGLKNNYKNKLNQHRKSIEDLIEKQKEQFETIKTNFIKEISDIKKELGETAEMSDGLVYLNMATDRGSGLKFALAMKLASRRIVAHDYKSALSYLKLASKDVCEITNNEAAKKEVSIMNGIFDKLEESDDNKIKTLTKEIREKYNSICYS